MGDDEEKLLDWSPMSSLAFPHMTDDDENTSAMCNTWMLPKGVTEIPEGVIFQNPLPPGRNVARGNACKIPKVSFFKILCPPGRNVARGNACEIPKVPFVKICCPPGGNVARAKCL